MTEWISVKDRLPARNQRVLVFSLPEEWCANDVASSFGVNTGYICEYGGYFVESLSNCGCSGLSGEITHWMPLPEFPKFDGK